MNRTSLYGECEPRSSDRDIPFCKGSLAIGDSSLTEIVRCQLNRHAVPGYYSYKVLSHLPSNMSYDLVAILELYTKLSPREGLNHCSGQFDYFLVGRHI